MLHELKFKLNNYLFADFMSFQVSLISLILQFCFVIRWFIIIYRIKIY